MFKDRFDAGHQLALQLQRFKNDPTALVLAIPRGGLQVGYTVAQELMLPLDVLLSKKIGYPGNPEYAVGAVTEEQVFIAPEYRHAKELKEYIANETSALQKLLHERAVRYRGERSALTLTNKTVIIVDDGIATGSTMTAAIHAVKKHNPHKIIIALPVAPKETLAEIRTLVDEVICLDVPSYFFGVGQAYEHFEQVDDTEAIRLYTEAHT